MVLAAVWDRMVKSKAAMSVRMRYEGRTKLLVDRLERACYSFAMYTTLSRNGVTMPEVKALDAAALIGVSDETIRRLVNLNILPARKVGLRGKIKVNLDDLRNLAEKLNYRFDEEAAKKFYEN